MNLNDLIPTPNSKQIAAVSHKVFGRSINVESLTKEKAQSLRETFAARLGKLESKLGANIANNPTYLENKLFLETLDTYLGEDDEMSDAARELELFAENDGDLYQRSAVPIMKNLSKKFKKGTYDPELGVKLWKYHADRAAKAYSEQHSTGDDWKTMFTPRDRMEMAKSMEDSWRSEMEAGNFMESAEVTESEAKADPDVVKKFAGVSDSQRSYYIMKWSEENDIDGDDAMIMAGYKRGDYMGAGEYMWNYHPPRITESVIVEGEMEAAEQVMASKNMVDKIQKMVEDLGGMLNEDLPPLTDSIRDNMDSAMADEFNLAMTDALSATLESMRGTREQVDAAARILTGEAAPEMMGDPVEEPIEEPAMEPTTDMDMEAPAEEEDFAAADAAQDGEEELGRARR
jgi:hypothetical protein